MSNWERLRASVQKMHGNASGETRFALGIVLGEMTTIELAPPEHCGCGHEHLPGKVLCYVCDLPVKATP